MGKILKVVTDCANEKYVKNISTDYNELSERCEEVNLAKEGKEVREIISYLKNTIRAQANISGLSANQIGFNKRIICLNFNGDIRTFINPIITNAIGFELSKETCHSIPDKTFIRPRNNKINITYQTPLSKIESVQLMGMAAKIMQHHIDHLDGILLDDIGLEIDDEFENASDSEKSEIINMYLDSMDMKKEEIEIDIDNDPEAKKISDGIKFMNAVRTGEVTLEEIPWTEEEIKTYEKFKAEQTKKKK